MIHLIRYYVAEVAEVTGTESNPSRLDRKNKESRCPLLADPSRSTPETREEWKSGSGIAQCSNRRRTDGRFHQSFYGTHHPNRNLGAAYFQEEGC